MKNYLSIQVNNNATWVRKYNKTVEILTLKKFLKKMNYMNRDYISIADVGCGNGRSIELIRDIFGDKAKICAIDKCIENIEYIKNNIKDNNIVLDSIDAFDFFSNKDNINFFNIVFFSWSFFDMTNEMDYATKVSRLKLLLEMVKKCLKHDGLIIVLQPTKGGVFEKLLSEFMPGSDADYKLVHEFLINAGFEGAKSAFPNENDHWTIWSEFEYQSEDDIYLGVSSVLYLEQRERISRKYFDEVYNFFKNKYGFDGTTIKLTDCVNLYYLKI